MEYNEMDLTRLLESYKSAKAERERLAAAEKEIKDEILFRYRDQIPETGTANVDGIKFSTPKSVVWDQPKLAALYHEIGESAPEYIDVKYSVSETKFKNWPTAISDQFSPARTVKSGSTTIDIIEE